MLHVVSGKYIVESHRLVPGTLLRLMLGPTHQKLKFSVVKLLCYHLKELVPTKPKLFEFFKYLNF